MEKNRICKICNRRFANGKAMGGHMRSHFAKLPLPPKPIPAHQPHNNHCSLRSPSSSSHPQNHASSTEKVIQSYRSSKPELSSMPKPNFAVVHDAESDAKSLGNAMQRRSKRTRPKSLQKVAESVTKAVQSPVQVSFTCEIFDEEECAKCLLMLSSDRWNKVETKIIDRSDVVEGEDREKQGVENEDEADMFSMMPTRSKRYRCEKCNKRFRSYQALGGHKASHKKIKTHVREDECNEERRSEEGSDSGIGVDDELVHINQRVYKCPLCDRVFESGQALGGHKKVHFTYLNVVGSATNSSAESKSVYPNVIDLNMPASLAAEDDSEVSQEEL